MYNMLYLGNSPCYGSLWQPWKHGTRRLVHYNFIHFWSLLTYQRVPFKSIFDPRLGLSLAEAPDTIQ